VTVTAIVFAAVDAVSRLPVSSNARLRSVTAPSAPGVQE